MNPEQYIENKHKKTLKGGEKKTYQSETLVIHGGGFLYCIFVSYKPKLELKKPGI